MRFSDSLIEGWFGMPRASLIEDLRKLACDLESVDGCVQAPSPSVAINSWSLARRTVPCLIGRPIGHPSIRDGKQALSSELFYFDPERGIARTMSRWYRLGTRVDPEGWDEGMGDRP
ncbi:hypothetical protein F3Y30_11350 [Sinorhizobium sp. BG8]|nr:hypothetical protein F3Y30_11350 [Sinorhizobium sp. BG8]